MRQYRPVVEQRTIEFPGGLREDGESPETTALRELKEETGFAATELVPLIECHADVGRLSNRFFEFLARRVGCRARSRHQVAACKRPRASRLRCERTTFNVRAYRVFISCRNQIHACASSASNAGKRLCCPG